MGHGQLNYRVQILAREFLGREMSVTELRLIPYVQYVMVNEQVIDIRKCNRADRNVLQLWREAGHIEGGASGLAITKEFWDFMSEVLWLTYVCRDIPIILK